MISFTIITLLLMRTAFLWHLKAFIANFLHHKITLVFLRFSIQYIYNKIVLMVSHLEFNFRSIKWKRFRSPLICGSSNWLLIGYIVIGFVNCGMMFPLGERFIFALISIASIIEQLLSMHFRLQLFWSCIAIEWSFVAYNIKKWKWEKSMSSNGCKSLRFSHFYYNKNIEIFSI